MMDTEGQEEGLSTSYSDLESMEFFISMVLRIGVTTCGIVTAIGLIWLLLTGKATTHTFPSSLSGIWHEARTDKPFAVIDTGLVILILTPVFRVATSVVLFLRERDRLYVGITLFVLCMLILSFALGKAGG